VWLCTWTVLSHAPQFLSRFAAPFHVSVSGRVVVVMKFYNKLITQTMGQQLTVFLRSALRLLVTANVVPSSPILVTLMMEAMRSSETSVLIRVTRRNIPGDGNLHRHSRGNLKA
jgi:hypothetical protein